MKLQTSQHRGEKVKLLFIIIELIAEPLSKQKKKKKKLPNDNKIWNIKT